MDTVESPPARPARAYWVRRAAGLLVDISVATTATDLVMNGIVMPLPRWVMSLLPGLALFVYWAVTEGLFGTTPGKAVVGLRVVATTGGGASARSVLGRSLFMGALLEVDAYGILKVLTADRVPAAFERAQLGAIVGYALWAIVDASRRQRSLAHDRITHTRVVAMRGAIEPLAESPGPRSARLGTALITACVAIGIVAGAWTSAGFAWQRLWTPSPPSLDQRFEAMVRRSLGLRSQVTITRVARWETGKPKITAVRVEMVIPLAAFDQHASQVFGVVAESLQIDPHVYNRAEFLVRGQVSGVLQYNKTSQWTYVLDSTGTWRSKQD